MEIFESHISGDEGLSQYLARKGFSDPAKAASNLRLISERVDEGLFREIIPPVIHYCSRSANPDVCLNNFERVSAAFPAPADFLKLLAGRPDALKVLAPLFASSLFLVRFILSAPLHLVNWLTGPGTLDAAPDREDIKKEILEKCPPETPLIDASRLLRRFKYTAFLRITARDLLGIAGISETTAELSNLADAVLEAAYRAGRHELDKKYGLPQFKASTGKTSRCPFTVIAMGKLGGRELNFSSDIDILFLYGKDGKTAGPRIITNHQYFVELSEIIVKLIGEKTADGFVFRVDTRLRPEGERGDLAQSLAGYETYYESWGRTWERSALIKARPCAGDMELGRDFTLAVRPFVFRKYLDYSAIAEIRDIKLRIESSPSHEARDLDVKLGPGGIREIEFFISTLQLVYGGREPGIREPGTLRALHRLALTGLITFEEQGDLARAYEFLRLAEHRLQVVDERQVHSCPRNGESIRALALRMGYRDTEKDAGAAFIEDYRRHTGKVHEIYDRLFMEQPVDVRERIAGGEFERLLSEDVTELEAVEIFHLAGFKDPGRAYRNFILLKEGTSGSPLTPRSRNLFLRILPALLTGCKDAPDPDMALNNLESFITSFGSREAIHDLVTETPQAAARMTRLFGSSEYFSRLLVSRPEMSDALLFMDPGQLKKSKEELSRELTVVLSRAESFAAGMDALREFKHSEELRVGIRDVFMNPGWVEISSELTALAEVVLEAALLASVRDMGEKYGLREGMEEDAGIAVIGFGKLGGRDLIYGSDLDITFVHGKSAPDIPGGEIAGCEFFDRISERVIFALTALTREGTAYRVDLRLRPGGSRGMLAHTLDGLTEYYAAAPVWELQALTRARGIAGDQELLAGFERMRQLILSTPREKTALANEILSMRKHLEREAAKGKGIDIKRGRGGIVDVEFAVQYLQLLHGRTHPELLVPGTLAALDKIIRQRLVPKAEGAAFRSSYFFMKELESRLRMILGAAETTLPPDEGKLELTSARMGYKEHGPDAAKALLRDYQKHAARIREIFDRIIL
ncbi:MAG: bifunctional [glutamate--ammonia ligase]-adenylyl-L-tyrosine phosphorylase/[glutamate--ammonia-ligase] adenylyltransferase [Nitrospirota bacterium]